MVLMINAGAMEDVSPDVASNILPRGKILTMLQNATTMDMQKDASQDLSYRHVLSDAERRLCTPRFQVEQVARQLDLPNTLTC